MQIIRELKKLKTKAADIREAKAFKKLKEMKCPCCGGQMLLEEESWQCRDCSYCISQKAMLDGAVFWFCDECGRFLNVQQDFTTATGAWKCVACGWANDVSEDNM